MNDELLNRCKILLEKLLEHGQFFQSAIEFNDFDIDGEEIEIEIHELLKDINS